MKRGKSVVVGGMLLFLTLGLHCSTMASMRNPAPSVGDSSDTINVRIPVSRVEYVPQWHSMFTNIPGDWARYGRSTFQLSSIPAIVGMTALTAVLVATDDETWRLSDRLYNSSSFAKETSDFFEYLGDGRPQFGLAAGFAVYGLATTDKRAVRTSSQLVEAILACGVVVQVIKHVTGRESPLVSTAPGGIWVLFPNQIEYHKHVPHFDAYPSGHIATALATVTVVAENYPEWTWVRPVGYTIVGLIGVAMANTGIHWYSDYPLGLALGYSFGMLAAHPEGFESSSSDSPSVSVAPLLSWQGTGISLSINF
jgi:membrane-associated phospholipid phosphatase